MQKFVSIVIISLLGAALMGADVPAVDQDLENLRLANEARKQAADATADWKTERQRLELLINEAERQESALQEQMKRDRAAIKQIQQDLHNAKQQSSQSAAIDAALLRLADETRQQLDRYQKRLPSGSIAPAATGPQAQDAAMTLLRETSRIQQSIANGKQWRVTISTGELDGHQVAYDQLSMGHVAAWWLSRDGERGGLVERRSGKNYLIELNNDTQVQAIKSAIAVARGERAPSLIPLPIQPQQLAEQAAHQ